MDLRIGVVIEFLPLETIRNRHTEISAALEKLLSSKSLVARKSARQWQFLRDSFNALISPEFTSDLHDIPPVQSAQYKFELEDRLRRYYLHPGNAVDFVFTVAHRTKLPDSGLDFEDYPHVAGYCLLIRDLCVDRSEVAALSADNLKLYLEKVVTEANEAEFRAYAALPEIRTAEIDQWFSKGSPAHNEIVNLLTRHQLKRWIISNLYNPSTKRMLDVKVKKVDNKEAHVNTMEYWYLRWWDDAKGAYAYSYRETNRQMYVLKNDNGEWKIFQNLRTMPRTSTPNRWNRRQK